MLELLHIENIAIIERADILFGRGFNALTGETGAGKSTLVKATPSTGNTKSLKTLLQQPEKYQVEQAIQLTADNVSRKGQILELPLYFGFLVGSY